MKVSEMDWFGGEGGFPDFLEIVLTNVKCEVRRTGALD